MIILMMTTYSLLKSRDLDINLKEYRVKDNPIPKDGYIILNVIKQQIK